MGSWWRRPAAGEGSSSSNSTPPDGIRQISDSVYSLSEPAGPPEMDIVLIHGLQLSDCKEAYWKTWMGGEKGKEVCWPMTWLREELPAARILSLSYDCCAFRTNTTGRMDGFLVGEKLVQELVEFAKVGQDNCPVVFVCHCLGGMVVKEIVIKAHSKFEKRPKYKSFLENIRGFHFYATPHDGSKLADWADHLPNMGRLVTELKVINDGLGRLNAEFERIEREHFLNKWQFSVVAETHSTEASYGLSVMVVEEASARHGYNKFLPVEADHFGVCKPRDRTSSSYQVLRNFIVAAAEDRKLKNDHLLELPSLVVGLEERLQEVCGKLGLHSAVGLVGMGGVGKTTLSKSVYNQEKEHYERSCFLEDVKSHGIQASQRQLFLDLCGEVWRDDENVNVQLEKIKQCIMTKKILLVVDDVGDERNMKALKVDVFKAGVKGSKVMLTTRRRDILYNYVEQEGIINVEILNDIQASALFSYYSFNGNDDGGRDRDKLDGQAKEIIKACDGLPLSLEVIGQFLKGYNHQSYEYGERWDAWKEALEKLREAESLDGSIDDKLWAKLRISYDDLDEVQKRMFLDFACVICEFGIAYETLVRIWQSRIGVQNLINRSLIKWNGNKQFLVMHDQLRDMGRAIVRDSANGRMSRLWIREEGLQFLLKNESSSSLEGLVLTDAYEVVSGWKILLRRMKGTGVKCFKHLRLLILEGSAIQVVEYYVQLCSEELRWLCLNDTDITRRSLRHLESFKKLQVLQMKNCKELKGLPASLGRLSLLMELDLSGCSKLKSLPDTIGNLEKLQRLMLYSCWCLEGLPSSIGELKSLEELEVTGCSKFKSLPDTIGNLENLQRLMLCACRSLEGLPSSIGGLKSLEELDVTACLELKNLPDTIGNLENLQRLMLSDCESLEGLPSSIGGLKSLEMLDVSRCSILKSLPGTIGNLEILQRLMLSGCWRLEGLPSSIGGLKSLEVLDVSRCSNLKSLPDTIGNLKILQRLMLSGCESLEGLPSSIGGLKLLEELDVSRCSMLKSLPDTIGNLEILQRLMLSGCRSLEGLPSSIGGLKSLKGLYVTRCSKLKSLPDTIGNLENLQRLMLSDCISLEGLPSSIGGLKSLEELFVIRCSKLKSLPYTIGNLEKLQRLMLSDCESLEGLPSSIGGLKSLEELDVARCSRLKSLPNTIGNLEKLQRLMLSGCRSLEGLPSSIGGLKSLETLDLSACKELKSLPDTIGNLENLQRLMLGDCKSLEGLPSSIGELKSLEELEVTGCLELKSLPDTIGNLENLQRLTLCACRSLEGLPSSIGGLKSLEELDVTACLELKSLPDTIGNLENLQRLMLGDCKSLEGLSSSIGGLKSLEVLDVTGCSKLKSLPDKFGNLENLQRLMLSDCESLEGLPSSIGGLKSLEVLDVSRCSNLKSLPDTIGNLKILQRLMLSGCESLEGLPSSIGGLKLLEELDVTGCSKLKSLPDTIGNVEKLQRLMPSHCWSLEGLPSSIGGLKTLNKLYVGRARNL